MCSCNREHCHHPDCEDLDMTDMPERYRCPGCGAEILNGIYVDCCNPECHERMHPKCAVKRGELTYCDDCDLTMQYVTRTAMAQAAAAVGRHTAAAMAMVQK